MGNKLKVWDCRVREQGEGMGYKEIGNKLKRRDGGKEGNWLGEEGSWMEETCSPSGEFREKMERWGTS